MNIQLSQARLGGADCAPPVQRHPKIAHLLANGPPASSALDDFLKGREFPLTEPGAATFAWRGAADHVDILRWIHAGGDRARFERVLGTDLWLLRGLVPARGRYEYKLAIGRHGGEEWILDPLNPARARDPFGENSECRTYGYTRPEWSEPRGAPAGRIEAVEVESSAFGERRQERVYLPAGYTTGKPYPLVIIHDGEDFVSYADLSMSLDNLIDGGDIPAVVAALIQTCDRTGEYSRGGRHARHLVGELLPVLASHYQISEEPEDRVLMGASLGAVASLSTAFRYPGVFGGLILQSGSFILDEHKLEQRHHPVFHRIARLVRALRRAPQVPGARAFVSTGELEGLAEENQALANFWRDRGIDVLFKSAWDGHHWHNWRDQLRNGLMWVLRQGQEPNR